jgi:hypothetical protein
MSAAPPRIPEIPEGANGVRFVVLKNPRPKAIKNSRISTLNVTSRLLSIVDSFRPIELMMMNIRQIITAIPFTGIAGKRVAK